MPVFPQPHHDYKLGEVCESCIRIFQLIGGWTVNSWFYNKLALCIIWSGQIIHFLFSRVQSRLATNTTRCHCYLFDIHTRLHLLSASQWPPFINSTRLPNASITLLLSNATTSWLYIYTYWLKDIPTTGRTQRLSSFSYAYSRGYTTFLIWTRGIIAEVRSERANLRVFIW